MELEVEIARLKAKHFPDDDTAFEELRELVTAFKVDLPRFDSASLNGITAIKENNYGTSTQ